MSKPEETAVAEQPQKLGLWGKTKLAVKEFFKGAVESIPKTIAYTALAFGSSAAISAATGGAFNPLSVHGLDKTLVLRMVGAVFIGSGVSGVIQGVTALNHADDPKAPATPAAPAGRAGAAAADVEPEVFFSPSMTPQGRPAPQPQRAGR